jgi:hypothetical protein
MADSIRWAVSVTPVEELADENAGLHNIVHSDVGKSLGGSGATTVTNLKYEGDKAIPDNNYVILSSGTDLVETVYIKCVSHDGSVIEGAVVSIDGGTTDHVKLGEGEAILLHPYGASGFGCEENLIRVKSTHANVAAVIEYLFDAP